MNPQLLQLERELTIALNADDRDSVVAALEARSDQHAARGAAPGTARGPVKGLAAKLIRTRFQDRPRNLSAWCKQLLSRSEYNAHEVGLMLLPDIYAVDPKFVQRQLLLHADSPNWEVRETAGSIAGCILAEHFDEFYPVVEDWTLHPSNNVRRAAVIAAMKAADGRQPQRGPKLLKLLDPLMCDSARYVRVNLGAFAVSLSLLKHYPQLTLKWLDAHSRATNQYARWNVAMVWSAVGGRPYAQEGARLLHRLAADERRFVWRAVASAAVKLGKARPDIVAPLLNQWKSDRKRGHVAEVAERYL